MKSEKVSNIPVSDLPACTRFVKFRKNQQGGGGIFAIKQVLPLIVIIFDLHIKKLKCWFNRRCRKGNKKSCFNRCFMHFWQQIHIFGKQWLSMAISSISNLDLRSSMLVLILSFLLVLLISLHGLVVLFNPNPTYFFVINAKIVCNQMLPEALSIDTTTNLL